MQRVFDVTQKFISAMDVIAMQADSVDDVDPSIRDLHKALQNYPNLPADYTGLATVEKWVTILSSKKAHDKLSEEEIRQLKFDLDKEYASYEELLKQH